MEALAAINAPDFHAVEENGGQQLLVTTGAVGSLAHGEEEEEEEDGEERLQMLMGLSLLLGFIFMLFVDQVGGGHSHAPPPGIQ